MFETSFSFTIWRIWNRNIITNRMETYYKLTTSIRYFPNSHMLSKLSNEMTSSSSMYNMFLGFHIFKGNPHKINLSRIKTYRIIMSQYSSTSVNLCLHRKNTIIFGTEPTVRESDSHLTGLSNKNTSLRTGFNNNINWTVKVNNPILKPSDSIDPTWRSPLIWKHFFYTSFTTNLYSRVLRYCSLETSSSIGSLVGLGDTLFFFVQLTVPTCFDVTGNLSRLKIKQFQGSKVVLFTLFW